MTRDYCRLMVLNVNRISDHWKNFWTNTSASNNRSLCALMRQINTSTLTPSQTVTLKAQTNTGA